MGASALEDPSLVLVATKEKAQMKTLNLSEPKKILIRSANWVGDAVMSTPTIRSVRKGFPRAKIYLLAKPWVSPVFYNSPHIDEIIVYDAGGRHGGTWGTFRLAGDLKTYRFDLAILLQNAFEAAFLSFWANVSLRLGYNTDGRGWLLTHPVPKTARRKRLHQLDYYLEIVKTAGLPGDGKKTEIFLSAAERTRAEQILGQAGADPQKPCVGINPGAAYGTAKRWFPRRYIELIRQIRANYSVNIVLFGSAREKKLGETIEKGAGNGCVNLIGGTSLREAMAVIEKCRLFITNDSGLMHVAAALDIPSIAIFGSTDHITTRPAGTNAQIIRKPSSCSPCMKPECTVEGHPCMENIGVTDVFAAASGILNNPG